MPWGGTRRPAQASAAPAGAAPASALGEFAPMGREYARVSFGIDEPAVGLLSNGEEPGKGDALRKTAYPLLTAVPGFIGNVEGRDLFSDRVDVMVTDGFTGNVAL